MTIEEMIEIARRIKICASKPFDEVCFTNHCGECPAHYSQKEQEQIVDALPELLRELKELKKSKWIPVVTRPLTEEEKQEYAQEEYDCIYECEMPEEGQDVLITTKYGHVALTTFYNDYGAYFEQYEDYDDVLAWMPLPEAYKERE